MNIAPDPSLFITFFVCSCHCTYAIDVAAFASSHPGSRAESVLSDSNDDQGYKEVTSFLLILPSVPLILPSSCPPLGSQHSSRLITYAPGIIIASQGDVSLKEIKNITKGTCKAVVDMVGLRRRTKQSSLTPVHIEATGFETNIDLRTAFVLNKRALIGDIAVLLGLPQPAYITAEETVEVLTFREDEIKQGLVTNAPQLLKCRLRRLR